MTKEVLMQYNDLLKEVEEIRERIKTTEDQIQKLENEGLVVDKVRGGEGGIQNYRIEGFPYPEYNRKKTKLYLLRATLETAELDVLDKLTEVEKFIKGLDDSYMRRIIRMRVVERMPWKRITAKMGYSTTEESVKMSYYRFMSEK